MHRGFFVRTSTPPLAGRRTPRPGPVRVCVCLVFLAGSGWLASRARSGAAHLFLWPLCLSALPGPLWAGVAPVLVLCLPSPPPFCFFFVSLLLSSLRPLCLLLSLVSGPGCPGPWRCALFFFSLLPLGSSCALACFLIPARRFGCSLVAAAPPPPPLLFLAAALCLGFFFVCAPVVSGFLWFPAPGALALGAVFCLFCGPPAARLSVRSPLVCVSRLAVGCSLVVAAPPPPFCVSRFSSLPLGAPFFFFPALWAPVLSGFLWFPAPGALGLGAVRCLLCWPPASRLSVRSDLFRAFRLAVGCSLVVAAPLCVSRFSSLPLGAVCRVLCCAVCPWVRCCAVLLRVVPPGVVLLCAVLHCCARLVPLPVVPCPLALPVALGPCALWHCVLRCSPAPVLTVHRVCFVVV